MAAYLPEELIISDILPRLPVKSIGRCRCVSKPWRSVLSTRHFAKTHLKFHADDPEDLIEGVTALRILTFTGDGEAAVSRQVTFPFEENSSFLMHGSYCLGYDSRTDDYKVACLSNFNENDCYEILLDVYSVKMKSWRRVGRSPYRPYRHIHSDGDPGVFLNGCIHWFGAESKAPSSLDIVAFDLAREMFNRMPFPRGFNDRCSIEFWVLEGCLALMPVSNWSKGSMDIWVMKEYGVQDSWIKRTIKFPPIEDNVEPFPDYIFFRMLNDDEILLTKDSKQLLAYSWRNESWRDLAVIGAPQGLASTSVTFKESLVSLNQV